MSACVLCGKDPALGFAKIGDDRYCHGDWQPDPTCYMLGQRSLVHPWLDPRVPITNNDPGDETSAP